MADKKHRLSCVTLYPAAAVVALVSAAVSAAFIARSAFEVDGQTYFSLFDDAMISMRYARNLAGGFGLVWNPDAAPIEGYSNLLWTLWMAVLHLLRLPEPSISLGVMITGAVLLIGNVVVVGSVARLLTGSHLPMLLAMSLTALYYPLVYWTLRGMEVGMLTFIVSSATLAALKIQQNRRSRDVAILCVLFAAAELTRDDATLLVIVIALWLVAVLPRAERYRFGIPLATAIVVPLAAVAIFRESYFHALLPNTYYLKMTGVTLGVRLSRGMKALLELEISHLLAPTVAASLVFLQRRGPMREPLLLAILVGTAALYSVYVGGDAWEWMLCSNRFITPVVPLLLVLASAGLVDIAQRMLRGRTVVVCLLLCAAAVGLGAMVKVGPIRPGDGLAQGPVPLDTTAIIGLWLSVSYLARRLPETGRLRGILLPSFLSFGLLVAFDWAPVSRWLSDNGYHMGDDATLTRTGLALRSALDPRASVAVFAAGAIPYFSHARSIDLLGKNDPVIARLPSHLPFFPGHAKWDYAYSIGRLRPDVVQTPWFLTEGQGVAARSELRRLGYEPIVAGMWVRQDSALDLERFRRELARLRRR
jgi:hypothetical protein